MLAKTLLYENGRAIQFDHSCAVTTTADMEKFVDRISRDLKAQGRILMKATKIVVDVASDSTQN